jgi:phosphate:Na+ symporter
MQAALHESMHLALAVFLHGETRDAERLVARKAIFREFEAAATTLSVRRLRSAAAASRLTDSEAAERVAQETGLFLRMVRDLRRIHSHLATFAYPALQQPRAVNVGADQNGLSEVDTPAAPTASPLLPSSQAHGPDEDG